MRSRRVGTFTLGVALIAVGGLYLVRLFAPKAVNLLFAVRFWPLALISLGVEVLLSCAINKEEKLRYDGWAIFLIICLMGFAWTMAAGTLAMDYAAMRGEIPWME